ncbi:MAG: DNA translocase FtsK [Caldilineaceae bacterium]|nr:DNA translocase FtsK [Caldilineaceae bacterium]
MPRSKRPSSPNLEALWLELRDSISREMAGMLLVVLGAAALLSLLMGGAANVAWLTRMMGWTAPWFALALIVAGAVLMLGERAGFWSAEALVGAELLLLSLQSLTFLANNTSVTWRQPVAGEDGGLLGWALGSLLMSVLGRWPSFFLLFLTGGVGLWMLLRFTPAVYFARRIWYSLPALAAVWDETGGRLLERGRGRRMREALPETENFVSAQPASPAARSEARTERGNSSGAAGTNDRPTAAAAQKRAPKRKTTKKSSAPVRSQEALPPTDLLTAEATSKGSADVRALGQLIESTLEDFNVPARVVHVESGPTVTQFGVEPLYIERAGSKRKVSVRRIVNLQDDLALALAAPAVRIEAPVPGQAYVGIEVPNPDKTLVGIRGILESGTMRQAGGDLVLPLGRDTAGRPVVMDLAKAPHMLIAGQTGAGKSVCINTIIVGLLMQHGPESLRFVMVDPKMVELPGYNGIDHLMGKVITDMDQVMGALTWLLLQMDDRYQLFREAGVRNLDAYNALARRRKAMEPLPYIVLIVDELADLMMTAAEDVERQICRLAQMARATGIHLILATQRPSTDVVTGLIKANFPTRIAFSVTSQIDSRVILDQPGAERLLGRGDMLLMRPDSPKLFRVQGCFVSDNEIERVVRFWKNAESDVTPAAVAPWNGLLDRMDDEDELVLEAMDVLRGMKTCSTSMLQRKLRLGYPKAARLMSDLEARGIVGPDLGGGQGREVLLKDEDDGEDDEGELF